MNMRWIMIKLFAFCNSVFMILNLSKYLSSRNLLILLLSSDEDVVT